MKRQGRGVRRFNPLRIWVGAELTPAMKQAPTLALFLLAVLASFTIPVLPVSSVLGLVGATALIVAATVFAITLARRETRPWIVLLIPAIDFVAIGLLRYSTGGDRSIFTSLAILPIVWLASEDGRRYIALAAAGGGVVFVLPLLLSGDITTDPVELLRGVYNPLSFGVAAAVVNELSRRSRRALFLVRQREAAAEADLTRAASVQRALLPKDGGFLTGYRLAGSCIPSRSVGGDFFDWYPVASGAALTMGDVMGKGVGAGMVAATARAVVRGAVRHPDPSMAMERMADCLEHDLVDAQTFLTLFHARLTASTGVVRYSDAGHGLSIVVRQDGSFGRLASEDRPVGMIPDDTWGTHSVTLGHGDALVSFSDGVLDLYDGTLAAVAEVAALAAGCTSAEQIVNAVREVALQQANDDDVTVVVLRRDAA